MAFSSDHAHEIWRDEEADGQSMKFKTSFCRDIKNKGRCPRGADFSISYKTVASGRKSHSELRVGVDVLGIFGHLGRGVCGYGFQTVGFAIKEFSLRRS